MNKEKFLRTYTNLSIFIGILLFVFSIAFIAQFPEGFNGLVSKSIFVLKLDTLGQTLYVTNYLIIILSTLFLLNLLMMFRIGNTEEVEYKFLRNVVFYNTVLSLMLIVSQMVFYFMIPEAINGWIISNIFSVSFEVRTNFTVHALNFNFILAILYFGYNFLFYLCYRLE